jgi:RNA polymerase sigma-70 factor (ECF subfamily)
LLDRLKAAPPDASDWGRLHDVYLPLIRSWVERVPGLGTEAADIVQEVFAVVIRELPSFERQREGSFRTWLRRITVNRVRTYRKRRDRFPALGLDVTEGFLDHLAAPDSELARQWDHEHDQHVFQKLLAVVRPDFSPATWLAFERFALDGRPAAQVAAELGVTENAVLRAKARILKRLREEAGGFLD